MTLSLFSNQIQHTKPFHRHIHPEMLLPTQKLELFDTIADLLDYKESECQRLISILYDIGYLCMEHGNDPEIIPIIEAYASAAFWEGK